MTLKDNEIMLLAIPPDNHFDDQEVFQINKLFSSIKNKPLV